MSDRLDPHPADLVQIPGDQRRCRGRLPLPPPLGFIFRPSMVQMHDRVGTGSSFKYLQSVFDYRGLHRWAAGQSQRVAERELHGCRPRDTVPLRPGRHHSHENSTDAALFKHARQNQHVLTAAGSSRGEQQRLHILSLHLLQHFGPVPFLPLGIVGDRVALVAHDGVGTGRL